MQLVSRTAIIPTFVGVLLLATAAAAEAQSVPRKLARGIAAVSLGLLEVPANVGAEMDARGPALGIPVGFARGVGMVIPRMAVGIYEVLTAPVPLPAGYRPIMEPEFPWGYFGKSWAEARDRAR